MNHHRGDVAATEAHLVLTSILSVGQYCLERHYARGSSRSLPPTPLQKIRATLLSVSRPKGVTA